MKKKNRYKVEGNKVQVEKRHTWTASPYQGVPSPGNKDNLSS